MCLMYLTAHTVCMISYDWHSPKKEVECVLQTAWKSDIYECFFFGKSTKVNRREEPLLRSIFFF